MIFFILLITVCSCKKIHSDINKLSTVQPIDSLIKKNMNVNEILFKSIDTTEFVLYWNQFREAVLNHDTATLSSMISDNIDGGEFLLGKTSCGISKTLFLENLNNLFTPEYLSLLEAYKVDKFLFSKGNNFRCWKTIKNITYEAGLGFDHIQSNEGYFYVIANYSMMASYDDSSYLIYKKDNNKHVIDLSGQDLSSYPIVYDLKFRKTPAGIKLFEVSFWYIVSISD